MKLTHVVGRIYLKRSDFWFLFGMAVFFLWSQNWHELRTWLWLPLYLLYGVAVAWTFSWLHTLLVPKRQDLYCHWWGLSRKWVWATIEDEFPTGRWKWWCAGHVWICRTPDTENNQLPQL